ncbi:DNA-(apurinic or apyrimidinic site) endonuclease [Dirofilaria immitis]
MYMHITLPLFLHYGLEYRIASSQLPPLLPGKCYSCSSENILKRWPHDDLNHIYYLRQLTYFANESCDRVKKSLPVVPCHKNVCVKLVIHTPSFGRRFCEKGPTIVRDCWNRAMWMDMDRNLFNQIIQYGSTQIQLVDTKNGSCTRHSVRLQWISL